MRELLQRHGQKDGRGKFLKKSVFYLPPGSPVPEWADSEGTVSPS